MTDKRAREKRILAWHFLPENKRLRWGTKEEVKVGRVYRVKGPLKMCEYGLHASERLIDALEYAPGPWICRVEVWGDVQKDTDKMVARNRKVLAMIDGTRLLHEFACDTAEKALKDAKVTDERSWAAIETKRKWLDGRATDEELAAAFAAAWAAAWAAAREAAWAAAWDAALAAAWAASWAAAREAAWAAAREAARDAAWDAANELLTSRVKKAMGVK